MNKVKTFNSLELHSWSQALFVPACLNMAQKILCCFVCILEANIWFRPQLCSWIWEGLILAPVLSSGRNPDTSDWGRGIRTPHSPHPSYLCTGVLVPKSKSHDHAALQRFLCLDGRKIRLVRVHQPCGRGGTGVLAGRVLHAVRGMMEGRSRRQSWIFGDHVQRNHPSVNYSDSKGRWAE